MMYALHTYVTHDVHCTNKLYLTCIQVMHTSYVLYTIRMVNTHCIHAPRPPAHLHVLGLHVLHDGDERVQRRAAAPPRAADAPQRRRQLHVRTYTHINTENAEGRGVACRLYIDICI